MLTSVYALNILLTAFDYENHRDTECKRENVVDSCVELFWHNVTAMKKAVHRFLCQPARQ